MNKSGPTALLTRPHHKGAQAGDTVGSDDREGELVRPTAQCWLTDMDGVLVREEHALPGAADFLQRLIDRQRRFLVLTNNSIYTPRDLAARLVRTGLDVPESAIWTSALATAAFLDDQLPGGSAYVIGEAGLDDGAARSRLHTDRHRSGLRRARGDPHLLLRGDHQGDSAHRCGCPVHRDQPRRHRAVGGRPAAATGSVAAMITKATGRDPYFVGKPNPMMFRSALNRIEAHSEKHRDGGGQDGHRRGRRHRSRAGDDPGADRLDNGRGRRDAIRSARPGSCRRSPKPST